MKQNSLKEVSFSDESLNDKSAGTATAGESPHKEESKPKVSWPEFIKNASYNQLRDRLQTEVAEVLSLYPKITEKYCCLGVIAPKDSISDFDSDRIFAALSEKNKDKRKDVLLILLSNGGSIEPAYQISKLCKSFGSRRFVVVVPRRAKSAATLITLGGDEIHIGPLGQLGPIDPQLGGLPALGVTQALDRIALLSEQHPGSSDMFAKYLRMALTVEQIGYCERISESAVQYAERLLSTKKDLVPRAREIALKLVYEFKDHGFVIDCEEAKTLLNESFIKAESEELAFAEKIYTAFEGPNIFLNVIKEQRFLIVGALDSSPLIFSS